VKPHGIPAPVTFRLVGFALDNHAIHIAGQRRRNLVIARLGVGIPYFRNPAPATARKVDRLVGSPEFIALISVTLLAGELGGFTNCCTQVEYRQRVIGFGRAAEAWVCLRGERGT
jgi:hypothetical protein